MGTIRDPSVSYAGREASWIHGFETSDEEVNVKIFSAFEGVKSFPFKRIIFQFWRLVADGERQVLESLRNVYAVSRFNRRLRDKYRACCMKYQYSITEEGDNPNPNPNPAWIISGGPFATAFLNHFPEVVLDLRVVHQLGGSPLAVCGLECDLTCCVLLPVFSSGECLGVVECSMKHPGLLLPIFNELKRELVRVGLSIYHLQGSWPYKTISGDLEAAKIEIEKALEIASESHALTLGQVWIPYEAAEKESKLYLVKLSGYSAVCSDDDPLSSIKDFYDKFDVITGEGLASKTLDTHQPYLCRNIYKLRSDNSPGVLALLAANAKSKCVASFVICLRSIHTGELDYAFEFFWPRSSRNHLIMLERLLLTLNKYLPSFKFASGEQLGDELSVVDVENSSSSRPVKIFLSEAPKSFNDDDDDDDDDDLAILAAYRNETLLFYLPSLSTYENVMEKLKKEFELDQGRTYKVEYEVSPGQWSSLAACLESCRSRIDEMDLVKLRVL